MNRQAVPDMSSTCPDTGGDTFRTPEGHLDRTPVNTRNAQVEALRGTAGHPGTPTTPVTGQCGQCGAILHAHNVTRRCAECKLIERNARMSGEPVDFTAYVPLAEAAANIRAAFPGVRVVDDRKVTGR